MGISMVSNLDPPPFSDTSAGRAPGVESGFAPGGEFTVGVEEELILVDAEHRTLADASAVIAGLPAPAPEVGMISREIFESEVEFATVACQDAGQVCSKLSTLRGALRRTGARALAAGLHPDAPLGDVPLTDAPRYRAIAANLAGLLRMPTAALQVHVGMPDAASAIAAYRGLRHHLAVLRALSASSPFWHGHHSGLASARWAVVGSYPRSGIPPTVHSWAEYVALTDAVVAAAGVPDYTYLWWDQRIQPRLGTIEVRVMDAQPSLDAVAGLTALVQGLARHAVERPCVVDMPSAVLAENDFRAARYGLQARLVDLDGALRPVRELAALLLAEARIDLRADGLDAPLAGVEKLLRDEPEYARQRRVHAEGGMPALLTDLATRTLPG